MEQDLDRIGSTEEEALAKLEREHAIVAPRLGGFLAALRGELESIFERENVSLGFPIETRVKSWNSLQDKLRRWKLDVDSVLEVNDLAGLRIILLFRRDVAKVDALLKGTLDILNAEDTGQRLDAHEFGYQSRHYAAKLPPRWLGTPSIQDYGPFRAEIQVRTVAQHIWAAASHLLQYKSEESVPASVRRSIHRAAALLETVDLEFERVLGERDAYKEELREAAARPNALLSRPVDSDSLRAYSKQKYPELEVAPHWHDRLLSDLPRDVYTNLGVIDQAVWRAQPAVEEFSRRQPMLFKASTDYLTKALGFVDEEFRSTHPFGGITRRAFEELGHLVRPIRFEKGQERQD